MRSGRRLADIAPSRFELQAPALRSVQSISFHHRAQCPQSPSPTAPVIPGMPSRRSRTPMTRPHTCAPGGIGTCRIPFGHLHPKRPAWMTGSLLATCRVPNDPLRLVAQAGLPPSRRACGARTANRRIDPWRRTALTAITRTPWPSGGRVPHAAIRTCLAGSRCPQHRRRSAYGSMTPTRQPNRGNQAR